MIPDISDSEVLQAQSTQQFAILVQSVKSRHQYLRFFKKVVNIAILELRSVSNESPGNFLGIL